MAETVLQYRTDRILIVLERSYDPHNHRSVLRMAESFGIQNVWIVEAVQYKYKTGSINELVDVGNQRFLSIQLFKTSKDCIEALKNDNREIWVTDLSPTSVSFSRNDIVIPPRLAIVFGREADGVSKEMKEAAQKRVYLPLHGFTESLNLSVAASLVVQEILHRCPNSRGDLSEERKKEIREQWFKTIGSERYLDSEVINELVEHPPKPYPSIQSYFYEQKEDMDVDVVDNNEENS
eukprot:TRINITY_DN10699_c0_g1_i1.p1 TRINITY_DN10699_c0_g1~~TRINITY_DN10699_c0_g1_i1.p1  ORF type:complete len:250 (+),score=40.94 TRINITY_DN10699_c0_g1_i1:43-750(+)